MNMSKIYSSTQRIFDFACAIVVAIFIVILLGVSNEEDMYNIK
jgi:hypothetical protein